MIRIKEWMYNFPLVWLANEGENKICIKKKKRLKSSTCRWKNETNLNYVNIWLQRPLHLRDEL